MRGSYHSGNMPKARNPDANRYELNNCAKLRVQIKGVKTVSEKKSHQYHCTPLEVDERLSYLRSLSRADLTEIWKL